MPPPPCGVWNVCRCELAEGRARRGGAAPAKVGGDKQIGAAAMNGAER